MDNRRVHPRFSTSASAELIIGEDRIPCTAQNLSIGGVGLNLSQQLAEGAEVVANIFLVEGGIEDAATPSVNVEATVIWTAPTDAGGYQAGLRFKQLSPEQAQLLQHFFARLGQS